MLAIILWVICGIGAAMLATSKNRSVGGWLIGGFLLGPIGLLIVACMSKLEPEAVQSVSRKCPFCAEIIKIEAKVCKHCGRDLVPESKPSTTNEPASDACPMPNHAFEHSVQVDKNSIICSSCGNIVPKGKRSCPVCHLNFSKA